MKKIKSWNYDGVENTVLEQKKNYVFCESRIDDSLFFSIFRIETNGARRFVSNAENMSKVRGWFNLIVKNK